MAAWTPERIARGLTHRAKANWVRRPGGDRFCIACGSTVAGFGPYRGGWAFAPDLMRAVDYTAGDYDICTCPRCNSLDRERHLLLYIDATNAFDNVEGATVVHFAPEPIIRRLIAEWRPAEYIRCDIAPQEPSVRAMDLMAMDLADATVDLLIANHVLEHVSDADVALAEIHRVLKPGGRALIQTPFSRMLLTTWEDHGITSETARLAAYGQEDHVRLFGQDVFGRIEGAGFTWVGGSHPDLLPTVDPDKHGVDFHEPFFLYEKK